MKSIQARPSSSRRGRGRGRDRDGDRGPGTGDRVYHYSVNVSLFDNSFKTEFTPNPHPPP